VRAHFAERTKAVVLLGRTLICCMARDTTALWINVKGRSRQVGSVSMQSFYLQSSCAQPYQSLFIVFQDISLVSLLFCVLLYPPYPHNLQLLPSSNLPTRTHRLRPPFLSPLPYPLFDVSWPILRTKQHIAYASITQNPWQLRQ
jgi:hypothetical protein